MRVRSREALRVVALAVLLVGAALLANDVVAPGRAQPVGAPGSPTGGPNGSSPTYVELEATINGSNVSTSAVPPDAEVTVVATQGFFVSDESAELVAFTRAGRVVYHDDTYQVYFDVDPVAGTRYTVEYVAARQLGGPACEAFETFWCTRNVVERVNLSTGAVERVWATKTEGVYASRYHDVDRINRTHLVVADIHEDRVFVVDAREGAVEREWRAAAHYARDQGGPEGDWTHINDVEVLEDGRIMVSVRNMDEVVFLRPGEGVQDGWTLGTDDDHGTLFEQHNPDYVPAGRGGPAVLVADSENNRVVEYRRVDGDWRRTWRWRDVRLQWPRDADRLPDGNTLIADSHGDRVLEVTPDGEVVWSVHVGLPYDAERLGTGDESAGPALPREGAAGEGAAESPPSAPPTTQAVLVLKDLLPSVWVNGLLYVSPSWVHFTDLLVAFVLLADLLAWGALEYRWSGLSVRSAAGRAWAAVVAAVR